MTKFARSLAAILGAMTLVAAPFSAQGQSNAPYKIGATFPLTGPLVQIAGSSRDAAKLAVAEINKAGGVHGHPLELVFEDTQGSPEGGIAAMRKVVQVDGVQAVLTIFTNVVTAQIPLADQLHVPTISTIETPSVVSKSQYSFAHAQNITQEAPYLERYWKAAGYKRIYAFLGNNAYGQLIEPSVKAAAVNAGAEYAESYFDLNQTDYRGTVAKARDFKPDAVFVAAQGSASETQVIRQVRELDITAPIYDPGATFYDRAWHASVGPYAEGMYFVGLNMDSRVNPRFVKAFRSFAGYDPTYVAAEWYDVVHMMAYAIGKAGYNADGIRNALAGINDVPSVFGGRIVMGPDHYSTATAMGVWQVRGGQIVPAPPPVAKH